MFGRGPSDARVAIDNVMCDGMSGPVRLGRQELRSLWCKDGCLSYIGQFSVSCYLQLLANEVSGT